MSAKEDIIKMIKSFSGKYSAYSVFYDFVKCSAISITNSCSIRDDVWNNREDQYLSIMKKYTSEEQMKMAEMFGMLQMSYEENIEDVLGDVYMRSGCYSKELGQFFTPFHLAELNARVGISEQIDGSQIVRINEPSTGGGANIIATAKVLLDRGINYQNVMDVVAQDLDWLAVYMSYVQFSLLGIRAEVAQGDTICDTYTGVDYPAERVLLTPKRMGVIL